MKEIEKKVTSTRWVLKFMVLLFLLTMTSQFFLELLKRPTLMHGLDLVYCSSLALSYFILYSKENYFKYQKYLKPCLYLTTLCAAIEFLLILSSHSLILFIVIVAVVVVVETGKLPYKLEEEVDADGDIC